MASWARLTADFEWRAPLVVLAAGLARRMGPAHAGRSKVLLPIREGDARGCLLDGIIDAWKPWVSELILVVRRQDEQIERLLRRQPVPARACVQPEPGGTTRALLGLADDLPDRFVVVLGDCLLDGRLLAPAGCFPGLAVWPAAEPAVLRANYGVRVEGSRVVGLQEKLARGDAAWVCGLGAYFLDGAVMERLAHQAPDRHGRLELTEGLDLALSEGIDLAAVELTGRYVNINTPDDLALARSWFGAP